MSVQASNSLLPLSVDQMVDPRINLLKQRYYSVLRSAQNQMQIPLPASGISDSSLQWTSPFTPSNLMDKRISVTCRFQYNATTAAPYTGPILNVGTYDCPSAYPIQSCVQQMSTSINTTSFQLPTNDIITAITTLRTRPQFRDKMLSTTPVWPDQYQEFSDGALTNRSPMGSYGDNPMETLRGGWSQIGVTTNTTSAASWLATYHEIILMPPLESGAEEGPSFAGITTNSWQMNLGPLTDSWNHMDTGNSSGSPVWNTFTASLVASNFTPLLHYNILTPHLIPALPSDVYYPLVVIDRMVSTGGTIAAWSGVGGASVNDYPSAPLTSNMITLSYVPSMLLIYVRESNAKLAIPTYSGALTLPYSQNCLRSKSFAGIKNVNITFNSLTGILNNASQHQLYEYSVETGLEMSFPQFQKYRGSVLALRFGSHIPLINPDLAPGCRGAFNFQVTVQAYNTNTSHEITAPNLYVLPYYEGTIIARPGVWIQQQGVISNQNVLESMNTPPVNAYYSDEIAGGGPFSFLKTAISKIAPIAEKIWPIAKALGPIVGPLIGLGLNEGDQSMHNIIQNNEGIRSEIRSRAKEIGPSKLVGRLSVRR